MVATPAFFVLTGVSMPTMGVAGGRAEVVKAEKVGIHDVKVIRGDSVEAITDWLKENDFGFDEEDTDAFADYVQRGWCFVAAKVEPDPGTPESKIAAGGMVAPLILTFETEGPVYPLALTATAGTETELLIYTMTENKLTCGDRLTLRRATQSSTSILTRHFHVPGKPEP